MGIDTPESRTSDPVEKIFGLAAKERVKHLLGANQLWYQKLKVMVTRNERKVWSYSGDFRLNDGDTLTSKLMGEGHAVAYNGGNKEKIQPKHVENRNRLVSEGKVDMQGLEVTKPALVQKPIVEEPVVEEVSAPVKKTKKVTKKKASKWKF